MPKTQNSFSAERHDSAAEQLDWQAFCYVTGELSLEQTAQFEDRLATDQLAREAVASALETLQLVTAAESLTPAVQVRPRKTWQQSGWQRGLAWMSLGAAAALLLAVALPRIWNATQNEDWQSAGLTPELAVAWSKTAAHSELGDLYVPADAAQDDDANDDDSEMNDSEPASRHAAPAWMVAAVRGLAEPKSPDAVPASPASPAQPVEMEN